MESARPADGAVGDEIAHDDWIGDAHKAEPSATQATAAEPDGGLIVPGTM
jgi:hypothetical protein